MKDVYHQFQELGSEVVAVSFAAPKFVAHYVQKYPLPFPAVSDPDRKGYNSFALDRTTWKNLFHPRVLGQYLRLIFQGWMPWKGRKGDDLLQLGGDFVLDGNRKLVYAHRSVDPTDRPSVQKLLEAVEMAVQNKGDNSHKASSQDGQG